MNISYTWCVRLIVNTIEQHVSCVCYLLGEEEKIKYISYPTISSETHFWSHVIYLFTVLQPYWRFNSFITDLCFFFFPLPHSYFLAHIRFGILFEMLSTYNSCVYIRGYTMWLLRDILLAKGLITSPNGNQVEWMCNGKKRIFFFFSLRVCVWKENARSKCNDSVLLMTISNDYFSSFCVSLNLSTELLQSQWRDNNMKSISEELNFNYPSHGIVKWYVWELQVIHIVNYIFIIAFYGGSIEMSFLIRKKG